MPRRVPLSRLLALALSGLLLFAACQPEPSPPPQRVAPGAPIPPSTTESVTLLNNERLSRGLPRLDRAGDLDRKAQDHAEWMARNRRLGHSNITAGVNQPYSRLGENVGVGSSVKEVHQAFMNSGSHRNHMLSSGYRDVGVGAARASDGRIYVAQVFRG